MKMMKLAGALERLKPWQKRTLGAGIIAFAGLPLFFQYNLKTFDSYESGADALGVLLPLYLLSLAAWVIGLRLVVQEGEEEFALMGDAFANGVLLLVNCFMMINLFPVTLPGRPQPQFMVMGAFWIPVAISLVHFMAGFLLFQAEFAEKIRVDAILKVAVSIVIMSYVLSVSDFMFFEKKLNDDPDPPLVDDARLLMAAAAAVTMVGLMIAWMSKLVKWRWDLSRE